MDLLLEDFGYPPTIRPQKEYLERLRMNLQSLNQGNRPPPTIDLVSDSEDSDIEVVEVKMRRVDNL